MFLRQGLVDGKRDPQRLAILASEHDIVGVSGDDHLAISDRQLEGKLRAQRDPLP